MRTHNVLLLGLIALTGTNAYLIHLNKRILAKIATTGEVMSKELDDLTAEVANATTIEQSAITLIQGLAAQLAAAGSDPVKLQALHDSLVAEDAALAAAIAANTPAAPPAQ